MDTGFFKRWSNGKHRHLRVFPITFGDRSFTAINLPSAAYGGPYFDFGVRILPHGFSSTYHGANGRRWMNPTTPRATEFAGIKQRQA